MSPVVTYETRTSRLTTLSRMMRMMAGNGSLQVQTTMEAWYFQHENKYTELNLTE